MSACTKQELPRNHLKEVNKKRITRLMYAPIDVKRVLAEKYFVRVDGYVKDLRGK